MNGREKVRKMMKIIQVKQRSRSNSPDKPPDGISKMGLSQRKLGGVVDPSCRGAQ